MRWTITLITPLLAIVLAGPALAQDGPAGTRDHGETQTGPMEMRMHRGMAGTLAAHAERLDLTDDQLERIEALDARLEAERERHHAEMRSIHEAAMEVLTSEQRDRMHRMMEEMHAERGQGHGEMKKHREMKKNGEKKPEGHDHEDEDPDDEDA